MARVHARDEVGFIAQNLQCETRAHCLTLCAFTRHVLLQICLICFVFVCPVVRLWLQLNALEFSNTFILN